MQIILPDALPDPAQTLALAPQVQRNAPTLYTWCTRGRISVTPAAAAHTGCTAWEQWQLQQRGFTPDADQNLGAGLTALLAEGGALPPHEPVWLVELVHIALARNGATLHPARTLALKAHDTQALYASAAALCRDAGFTLHPHSATHWRIVPSEPLHLHCASPELVARTSVHDWWSALPEARAWRQLFNAIQMHWFDHPVNQTRAMQHLPPINGLWLFGGARPAQLPAQATHPILQTHMDDTLADACLQQDWGAWLAALSDLERTVFAPLRHAPDVLVLTGRERIVEISPTPVWRRWLPRRTGHSIF